MIRKTLPIAGMLAALFLLTANVAVAQKSHELVADIPFDFSVCGEQLLAGKYIVRPASDANPRVLLVSNYDNRSVIMACAHDVQMPKPTTTGKLIFNRYGNQYFLSEVWLQGEKTGGQLTRTEQEEALLGELKGAKKREKVTVKVTELKPK